MMKMTRRAYTCVSLRVIRGQQAASWRPANKRQMCNFDVMIFDFLEIPKFKFSVRIFPRHIKACRIHPCYPFCDPIGFGGPKLPLNVEKVRHDS